MLSLEIGSKKKLFYSILNYEEYFNKTHLLNFIYNSLTCELNVEIIIVENNEKILELLNWENL